MHEQEPKNSEHQDNHKKPEREPKEQPRIYVASLSDYNEGRLYGKWIDAAQDAEELQRSIDQMLRDSPSPCAEEWAVHDYEGFGPLRFDEFESMDVFARVAKGIATHGPAFAAWAAHVGTEPERLDEFEEAFMGGWENPEAFAEEMLDDMGQLEELERNLPEHLAPYVKFDYKGYFDDLVAGGAICSLEKSGGGIYVFWN